MRNMRLRGWWRLALIAVSAVCLLPGQTINLANIRGRVVDPTGAVVVGAKVTAVNTDTNNERNVATNESGDYEILALQPGKYRLTVVQLGFETFEADNIIVEGGETRRIDATLAVGQVGTKVSVTAGAAVITTESAKVEDTVSSNQYVDNALINVTATFLPQLLLTTLPLVQSTGSGFGAVWAGQNTTQIQQAMDGHLNDGFVNQLNDVLDADQIVVVTVLPTAEVARVGYFNEVTKSGSNAFHGRVLYWNVNPALKAREFFQASKVKTFKDTQSVAVSGPILRNKLFFYAAANGAITPSATSYVDTVPTAAMRNGDFSGVSGIIKDPLTGQPFPGNIIPANRINSVAAGVNQHYLPAPNIGGPNQSANNYTYTFPYPQDNYVREDFTQRLDYNITDKNRLMGRLIIDDTSYVLPDNYPVFTWTRVRFNYNAVVEDTHIFTPNVVNTARVGVYKEQPTDGGTVYGVTPVSGTQAVSLLGLQGVNPKGISAQGFPSMAITGYPTLTTDAGGSSEDIRDWGISDTVAWTKGRHLIKIGFEERPQFNTVNNAPTGTYGSYTFNGTFTGNAYADFLLGYPYTSSRLNPLVPRSLTDNEFGAFIQDDFKVSGKLTLTFGVRYDVFGPPGYNDGLVYNWSPHTGALIVPSAAVKSISPLFPANIPITTGPVIPSPDWRNIAPRFGAAYRLGEHMVIRGGYGIYTPTLGVFARAQGGGPFQITETYVNSIVNGQPLLSFPNPYPASTASATVPSQTVSGYPLSTSNGRIHQYSVTLERQIKNVGLRLTYTGSRDIGLNYLINIDKPQPSLAPFTQSSLPYPQYTSASYWRSNGETKFNSLTVEAERKVGQLIFAGHWVWSSSLDNMLNLENPYAPLAWNRDAYPSEHSVVVSAMWQLPIGRGRSFLSNAPPIVNYIVGGWNLSWISTEESGHFFSPSYAGSDASHTNTSGGLPNRVCDGNLPSSQRTINHWFDASCFTVPAPGSFGNSGVDVLVGPGFSVQDVSLAKAFNVTEKVKVTLTGAYSNLFNHPNFSTPASVITSPGSVGVISSEFGTAYSRIGELRIRIDF